MHARVDNRDFPKCILWICGGKGKWVMAEDLFLVCSHDKIVIVLKKEQSILFLNRRGFASILFAKNAVMLRPANIVAYQ